MEQGRIRGFDTIPRNHTQKTNSVSISEKTRNDVRARRMFVCSAQSISPDTPIDATSATTVEKKNPDRTIITDRRAISDIRRINQGFNPAQYYPARVPKVEALARLLVSTAVSFTGVPIDMAKRDIASDFRLLWLRPSLPLLMCAELPAAHFNVDFDLVLLRMVIPFGRGGAPANVAFFGGANSSIHSQIGMGRPDWFFSSPPFRDYMSTSYCLPKSQT